MQLFLTIVFFFIFGLFFSLISIDLMVVSFSHNFFVFSFFLFEWSVWDFNCGNQSNLKKKKFCIFGWRSGSGKWKRFKLHSKFEWIWFWTPRTHHLNLNSFSQFICQFFFFVWAKMSMPKCVHCSLLAVSISNFPFCQKQKWFSSKLVYF